MLQMLKKYLIMVSPRHSITAAIEGSVIIVRGHSFSTYAQRGEGGVKQMRTACVQGGGGLHMEVLKQKCPLLQVFCDVFICWNFYHTWLSLASTFITVLQNICYDYFLVSQMFCSLFLHGIIFWKFRNIPIRNSGGGVRIGMSTYAMGRGS